MLAFGFLVLVSRCQDVRFEYLNSLYDDSPMTFHPYQCVPNYSNKNDPFSMRHFMLWLDREGFLSKLCRRGKCYTWQSLFACVIGVTSVWGNWRRAVIYWLGPVKMSAVVGLSPPPKKKSNVFCLVIVSFFSSTYFLSANHLPKLQNRFVAAAQLMFTIR